MMSLAKNDRGMRLAATAVILLPIVGLIFAHSRSQVANLITFAIYFVIASAGALGFLCERAELAEERESASRGRASERLRNK